MFRRLIAVSVCAVCVGSGVLSAQGRGGAGRQGGPAPVSAQPKSGETYLWHGEIVSFDGAARTLTLKTRILRDAAADVGRMKPGERVLLTWSGLDIHAGAVRRVARFDATQKIVDFFALPAELASTDTTGDMITIRIRVPDTSLGTVKGLKPGDWVSVTARQRPATDAEAVGVISAYIKSQN